MLEANPRASRTVPFASKAIGVNLVDAACRLAAGERLAELALPPEGTAGAGEREGGRVSVRALPRRGSGARARDALDRRGDGERGRLPDRVREGRAGRRPAAAHRAGRRSSRCATRTRTAAVALGRRARRRSASRCVATAGTARALAAAGLPVDARPQGREEGDGPTVVDLIRRGRCDLVVNTPAGRRRPLGRLPDPRGRARRPRAVHHDASPARPRRSQAIARRPARARPSPSRSALRSERLALASRGVERGRAATRSLARRARGGLEPGVPGQFFMLEAPGRLLPRPMSLCLAPRGELGVPGRPDRPGDAGARARSRAGDDLDVLGPLGNGFRLDVERPLLVGGGIGVAPLPYLSEALGRPPARARLPNARGTPRRRALVPNAEVVVEPTLVTELLEPGYDVLACGPEPMLARGRASSRRARSSPGRRRWPAATAPATAARSRSTASCKRLCVEGPVLATLRRPRDPQRLRLPRRARGARCRALAGRLRDEDGHAAPARRQRAASGSRRPTGGMLNSIGLANPGIDALPRRDTCRGCRARRPALGLGRRLLRRDDYADICARLDEARRRRRSS